MTTHSPIEDIQRRAVANAVANAAAARSAVESAEASPSGSALAPIRHSQQDFVLAQISAAPISCLVGAQIRGLSIRHTVRLSACELLVDCNRGTSGTEFDALAKAFERLAGTHIRTDITSGKKRSWRGFGLVESSLIVERTTSNRMASIELTLLEWAYNAIVATEVLTFSLDDFRFRKSLERRVYELARKHSGDQKAHDCAGHPSETIECSLFTPTISAKNSRDCR